MASFFKNLLQKSPIAFPWIALFHFVMIIMSVWSALMTPLLSEGWIQPVWAILFSFFWVFVCDLKKWAAYAYIFLTTLSLLLRFYLLSPSNAIIYSFCFYEIIILFSFFILFYFKRYE